MSRSTSSPMHPEHDPCGGLKPLEWRFTLWLTCFAILGLAAQAQAQTVEDSPPPWHVQVSAAGGYSFLQTNGTSDEATSANGAALGLDLGIAKQLSAALRVHLGALALVSPNAVVSLAAEYERTRSSLVVMGLAAGIGWTPSWGGLLELGLGPAYHDVNDDHAERYLQGPWGMLVSVRFGYLFALGAGLRAGPYVHVLAAGDPSYVRTNTAGWFVGHGSGGVRLEFGQ